MKVKFSAGIAAVLLVFIVYVHAQEPKRGAAAVPHATVQPKAPYDSDHAQMLVERQKRAQADEMVLEMRYRQQLLQDPAYQKIVAEYSAAEQQLSDWINQVRKANGWDGTYNYDRATDTWTHPAEPKGSLQDPAYQKHN